MHVSVMKLSFEFRRRVLKRACSKFFFFLDAVYSKFG
jgi:hypothetical protein